MKTERSYPRYTVTPKGEAWLKGGHPWVYEDETPRPPTRPPKTAAWWMW